MTRSHPLLGNAAVQPTAQTIMRGSLFLLINARGIDSSWPTLFFWTSFLSSILLETFLLGRTVSVYPTACLSVRLRASSDLLIPTPTFLLLLCISLKKPPLISHLHHGRH